MDSINIKYMKIVTILLFFFVQVNAAGAYNTAPVMKTFDLEGIISANSHSLSQKEKIEVAKAHIKWRDSKQIYQAGDILGWMRYCDSVSSSTLNKAEKNMIRWIRIAASEYDLSKSGTGGGTLNNKLFSEMMKVFNKGVKRGKKEGKIGARAKRSFNNFCKDVLGPNPASLNTVHIKPPIGRLGLE